MVNTTANTPETDAPAQLQHPTFIYHHVHKSQKHTNKIYNTIKKISRLDVNAAHYNTWQSFCRQREGSKTRFFRIKL